MVENKCLPIISRVSSQSISPDLSIAAAKTTVAQCQEDVLGSDKDDHDGDDDNGDDTNNTTTTTTTTNNNNNHLKPNA